MTVEPITTTRTGGSLIYEVIVIGGGAAGISVTASLLSRDKSLNVAIIEPRETHYYKSAWTLVGGGVFDNLKTIRSVEKLIPSGVKWIKSAAAKFEPDDNVVILDDSERVHYKFLIVCPGLKLDWEAIPGLPETLGKNGVTSNYEPGLASYTWRLVKGLEKGTALFTQPPMPIKCAGAPQKAMYLSSDHWRRHGHLGNIDVSFNTAADVLFGVDAYVPALMEYIKRYGIQLHTGYNLTAISGHRKVATFEHVLNDGGRTFVEKTFDFIHVCPPQLAPDFIRKSPFANGSGWVEVDQETLQHVRYDNVFALGDVCSTPNAKTAAAVRVQSPVVARNVLSALLGKPGVAIYNGYGSCPLTVERGKIVLAEFGYGGKLLPTFPFIDGTRPSRLAWLLKKKLLPGVYWKLMLKGREWLVKYGFDTNRSLVVAKSVDSQRRSAIHEYDP